MVIWFGRQFGSSSNSILSQKYNSNGEKIGFESVLLSTSLNNVNSLSTITLENGDKIIGFVSTADFATSTSLTLIRVSPDGNSINQQLVIDRGALTSAPLSLATLDDGGWLVGNGDAFQMYDPAGTAVASWQQVATSPVNSNSGLEIVTLADGGWIAAWTGSTSPASPRADSSETGVYQRRYDAAGNPLTAEVLVNTTTNGFQSKPKVLALADGGWIVVWASEEALSVPNGIYQQRFNPDGTRAGNETMVTQRTGTDVVISDMVTLADGGWLVALIDVQGGRSAPVLKQYDALGNPVAAATPFKLPFTYFNSEFRYLSLNPLQDGSIIVTASVDPWDIFNFPNITVTYEAIFQTYLQSNGKLKTIFNGDSLDNVFYGSIIAETIFCFDGNDTIYGSSGADFIDGGNGIDTLSYQGLTQAVFVNLQSSSANDGAGALQSIKSVERVIGSAFGDQLTGSAGNDELIGADGSDVLSSGAGSDSLTGGTGNDTFINSSGLDVITDFVAGGTDDSIKISTILSLSDFAKVQGLTTQIGADTIITFGFNNVVTLKNVVATALTAADFTLAAPVGNNPVNGTAGPDTLSGTAGVDSMTGGNGNDTLDGLAGNDTIVAGDGNDYLLGGADNDLLDGGIGNDILLASTGDDTLIGGGGVDYLFSGTGNNVLSGGAGLDILISEGTNDIMNGGADQNYYYRAANGTSQSFGGDGVDILVGGTFTSNDLFYGFGGDDYALGGAGNDELIGGIGNDILISEDGYDTLDGGTGINYLYADGTGSDLIRVNALIGLQTQLLVSFEGGGVNDSVEISGSTLANFAQFQTLAASLGVTINGNLLQNTGAGAILTLYLGTGNQTDIWFLGTLAGGLTAADFVFV
jgi:Ca2+-binding RTX toxin-like protein